jgi:hypothetical protein
VFAVVEHQQHRALTEVIDERRERTVARKCR